MKTRRTAILFLWVVGLALVCPACSVEDEPPKGYDPQRHMGLDEIRPGMVGYGLSVFQGTEIETFDVEVLSVEHGHRPGKSVIWVRCTDERMQKLGPVKGMSGSPIFLWPEGTRRSPGKGGRMIGAFAYGYPMGKDCMVGVQPIEQMLAAEKRAQMPDPHSDSGTDGNADSTRQLIRAAHRGALANGVDPDRLWRLDLMQRLLGDDQRETTDPASTPETSADSAPHDSLQPMLLPVRVHSTQLARALGPMFRTRGMAAVTGGGGGLAPKWIDPDSVGYQPGGVLAVPMVRGDVDMAGIGTITEVLADGTILAFGHAMYGQGKLNVPIATGFVHYVQPSLNASFKMGGALQSRGALVNDETVAVIGMPEAKAKFLPSTVQVIWPDASRHHTFHYELADNRVILPMAAGYSIAASIGTDTAPPLESTVIVQSTLNFEGGRTLDYRTLDSTGTIVAVEVPALVGAMSDNPFHRVRLENMTSRVEVVEEVLQAAIRNVHLPRQRYQPGETVSVTVELLPFRGEPYTKQIEIDLPENLAEGEYPLQIGGAKAFVKTYMQAHTELAHVASVDDLYESLKWMQSVKDDALYAVMPLPSRVGLRIGRTTLPRIPDSRKALLASPTDTQVAGFAETLESRVDLGRLVMGQWQGAIEVKRDPNDATSE